VLARTHLNFNLNIQTIVINDSQTDNNKINAPENYFVKRILENLKKTKKITDNNLILYSF